MKNKMIKLRSHSSRFYLSLFLFSASIFSSQTADTIDTSQPLTDIANATVVSSAGAFALGFFSPGNSKNRYVGIWYNKIKDKTVVWIANRDAPLTDGSGMLRLVGSGRLLLLNSTNATVWSTNSSTGVANPIAQLLDSGNLVVRDANDENPKNYLWQSFDFPSDTFLPGMKLGRNFRTGLEVYIASAKSNDDPATGSFTYHCDPSGYPQTVIKEGSSVRFKTGPWNGVRFSGSHNLVKNNIFTFGVVINEDEVYYHYQLLNDSVYMRFVITEGGVGQRWLWSYQTENWILYLTIPTDNCDIYSVCGANGICDTKTSTDCSCLDKFEPKDPRGWGGGDFLNGCVRRTPFHCQNGDGFLKYSGVKLPDTERSWHNSSMTLQECKVECTRNCSCTAYASLDISRGESGCLLWFGDLVDMREVPPGPPRLFGRSREESDTGLAKALQHYQWCCSRPYVSASRFSSQSYPQRPDLCGRSSEETDTGLAKALQHYQWHCSRPYVSASRFSSPSYPQRPRVLELFIASSEINPRGSVVRSGTRRREANHVFSSTNAEQRWGST